MTTLQTTSHASQQQSAAQKLIIRFLTPASTLVVTGRSTGLEILPAYRNLIDKAEEHLQNNRQLNCYFNYQVINASTTKLLFNLFSTLNKYAKNGKNVVIYWLVQEDDEDLIDVGLDFKNAFELDFKIQIK
ncbi:MAG: SiaC family regulatory phosphoprotein [Marinoscillum sp.]